MPENQPTTKYAATIAAINAPLGFFVLALLIVEGFLGIAVLSVEAENKMTCVCLGVILFAAIVSLVAWLVVSSWIAWRGR